MDILQTDLYSLHLEYQAKMVVFAGFEMPLQYPSGIIEEHQHTRSKAGLFDISHMGQFVLKGKQSATELEKLCPGNITDLQSGQQRYTVFTNEQGGILDDLMITRYASDWLLVVNAARKKVIHEHLINHLPDHCQLEELIDCSLLALQGPLAAGIVSQLVPAATNLLFMQACQTNILGLPCRISRSGYTGEDGFEISVSSRDVKQLAQHFLTYPEVLLIGLGARDTLRLEAGLCLYGHELTETITPVEAGLNWIFRKQGQHYPGAQKINLQRSRGTSITRVGIQATGRIPVRDGAEIINADDQVIGRISSGGFGPSVGTPVAMGYIQTEHASLGKNCYAKVRNRTLEVTLVPLPFIPHRYHRKKP